MASNADRSSQPGEKKKDKTRHRPPSHDSKQHNHKPGPVFNIHLEKVDNLQVGNKNKMIVNYNTSTRTGPYTCTRSKVKVTEVEERELTPEQHSRLEELQVNTEEVDSNLMAELAKCWGRCWHKYGQLLTLTDTQLQNIDDNVHEGSDKLIEVSKQVLQSWKKKTDDSSVKNLISLLTQGYDYTPIMPLLDSDDYCNPTWTN